jgi:glycosyltransferase involved in cell wall biosynthesis
LKILIITINSAKWGGSEELWCNVAEESMRRGHAVMVSVFDHGQIHERIRQVSDQGARLHKRPLPSFYREAPLLRRVLSEFKTQIGLDRTAFDWLEAVRWKPDVVLISSGATFDHILHHESHIMSYCRGRGLRCYLISHFNWEHDLDVDEAFRESRRRLVDSLEGMFFVSYRNLQCARMQMAQGIGKARIIHNPVKTWSSGALPYPSSRVPKLACVARLQLTIKGQDLLLQALSQPEFREIPFELTFYGSGDDRGHLLRLIDFYGLSDKAKVAGFVHDVDSIWRDNQLMVLASRAEGTPLSLHEAMKCGRSALVTNSGDSALWVGADGFIAESSVLESIGAALKTAFRDFEKWEELGRRSAIKLERLLNTRQVEEIVECLTGARPLSQTGFDPDTYMDHLNSVDAFDLLDQSPP